MLLFHILSIIRVLNLVGIWKNWSSKADLTIVDLINFLQQYSVSIDPYTFVLRRSYSYVRGRNYKYVRRRAGHAST